MKMNQLNKGEKIAEGKTKIIWVDDAPGANNKVFIESKDDITAGDGDERNVIDGKGVLSTEITANCFRLLKSLYIPTHFSERVDEWTFSAWRAAMIPLELVVRRIATGSYLDRNPAIKEGLIFDERVVEFFLKDDERHNPLMIYDIVGDRWLVYEAHKPLADGFIEEMDEICIAWSAGSCRITSKGVLDLRRLGLEVFGALEYAWGEQNVGLVDLKIECGFRLDNNGRMMHDILVADVINNDSWHIWPGGDKSQMKDKQIYRDLENKTPEAFGAIQKNYQWVAEATAKFLD